LTAKYKKDTVSSTSSASTKSTVPQKTNISVRQGRTTTAQRTGRPQRTPLVEDTRPDKVVPAATSVASQGIVVGQTKPATESRDFGDKVISSEIDEDGNRTGKWDQNKDLAGMSNFEKWWEGIKSPYEQPAQMVKNIVEGVPAEKQMVKDTALDLAINPLIETVVGAKDLGITNKNWYWPDQLTGLDHPSAPAFLRTGGGSGADILGGIANNLGYLQDVVTSEKTGAIIGSGYEESGQRFMDQPAYYVGSAIGEVPMWFIGVGPAKAVATVSSKAALTTIKTAAATGKLPGPKAIKAIVETEMNHSRLVKTTEAAKRKADIGHTNFLPRGFNNVVKQSIKLVSKDLDIKKIADIKQKGNKVKELKREVSQEARQLKTLRNSFKQTKDTRTFSKIKAKEKQIKTLNKQINLDLKSIKKTTQNLDSVKLNNKFKRLSEDKTNQGQRELLAWVVKKDGLQTRVQTKFEELPNQVKVLKATRLKHLQAKQDEIRIKARKITGKNNIDESFWGRATKEYPTDGALPSGITAAKKQKLMKLRESYLKISDDVEITTKNEYTPWAETIRKIERVPGAVGGKWSNLIGTRATRLGDEGVLLKQKVYSGFSGELRKIYDYHAEHISLARSKEVNYWADYLGDSFAGIGHVSRSEMDEFNAKLGSTKTKLMLERETIDNEITLLETENPRITKESEVKIQALNKDMAKIDQTLDDIDGYNFKQFASKIPGKGTSSHQFFFEPDFLKRYLTTEAYAEIMPKEITYVTRPVVDVVKKDGRLTGSITSDAVGEQIEFIIQRTPSEPSKYKAVRYAKKFKPRGPKSMRIRDRYMTLSNSQLLLTSRKRNPFGDDIVRVPKDAPDKLKDQILNAYAEKLDPKKNTRMLLGMTGGENYDLYKLKPITDQQRITNAEINIGPSQSRITKDNDLDRLKTVTEIENTRAYLRGDSDNLNESLNIVMENLSKFDEQLIPLVKKQGTDKDTNPLATRDEISSIKKFQAAEFKRKDDITSKLQNIEEQETLFADSGVSIGFQRGAVSIIDPSVFATNKPLGFTTMVKHKKTNQVIMFHESRDGQLKMYELDDVDVYNKIRPDDVEFGTKTPDDMVGLLLDEDTKTIKPTSMSVQPFDTPLASNAFSLLPGKDQFNMLGESSKVGSISGKNQASDLIKSEYIIRLGNDAKGNPLETAESLSSKGIRELTPEEVVSFETGNLFSKNISDVKKHLSGIKDDVDIKQKADGSQTVNKSKKTQLKNIIDAGVSKFSIGMLSETSLKVRNIRNALTEDEWSPVRLTSKAVSSDSLQYSTDVQKGIYKLGTDQLTPFQRLMLADSDKRLFGVGDTSKASSFSTTKIDDKLTDVKGLEIYNVMDLGVVGGRVEQEISSKTVARRTADAMYRKYKESSGNKNKYEELVFAARQQDSEEVFKIDLLQAYAKMKNVKAGNPPGQGYSPKEARRIVGKTFDKEAKEIKYEPTDEYKAMLKDVVDNDLLREVTMKDRLSVVKRGRAPTAKNIERKVGVISINFNFKNLSNMLPEHSLVGRAKNKAVSKFQTTDDFLSSPNNLLGGFFSQASRRILTPRIAKRIQEDIYVKEGFLEAVEFAQSKGIKIDKQYIREYNRVKGRYDSFSGILERVELSGNKYGEAEWNVQGKYGTGSYTQAVLSPEESTKLQQINNKLKTLEFGDDDALRQLGIKVRVKNDKGDWVEKNVMDESYTMKFDSKSGNKTEKNKVKKELARNEAELKQMKKQLKKLKLNKNPSKKDIAEKQRDITQHENVIARQKDKLNRWDSLFNKKVKTVSDDARENRLNNA